MRSPRENQHQHICQSLELFAAEVMGEFKAEVAEREARKAAELAPYLEAAMARKRWMRPLADDEIPRPLGRMLASTPIERLVYAEKL